MNKQSITSAQHVQTLFFLSLENLCLFEAQSNSSKNAIAFTLWKLLVCRIIIFLKLQPSFGRLQIYFGATLNNRNMDVSFYRLPCYVA